MLKIESFAAPICPWCYFGKCWLDQALESFPAANFLILWKPFQLNPELPQTGMDRVEYLQTKFGGESEAALAYGPIKEAAKKNKIKIEFEKIKRTPNTLNAHRLIFWAGLEGLQSRIVSRLFKAYFQEGIDISSINELIILAKSAGMKSELVKRLFYLNEDITTITELDLASRKIGIKGVPLFILGNEYVISGAKKATFWKKVFNEILYH